MIFDCLASCTIFLETGYARQSRSFAQILPKNSHNLLHDVPDYPIDQKTGRTKITEGNYSYKKRGDLVVRQGMIKITDSMFVNRPGVAGAVL